MQRPGNPNCLRASGETASAGSIMYAVTEVDAWAHRHEYERPVKAIVGVTALHCRISRSRSRPVCRDGYDMKIRLIPLTEKLLLIDGRSAQFLV